MAVYNPFTAPERGAGISSAVEAPYTFRYAEWDGDPVTVTAELRGNITYVPPRPYTGIPLREVLVQAEPKPGATVVRVIANDGYEARFALDAVRDDAALLLTLDAGRLQLAAAAYDGAHWVKRVTRLVVE